ncbi:MAG TPA: PAS domain S-box protein [Anaerolineae bacterium]|nr:PAS domain S-box protein [Anaerolineae bacterium]
MSRSTRSYMQAALRITLVYAVVAGLWIALSDQVLLALVTDARWLTQLQTSKGALFVFVTSAVLFLALQQLLRQRARAAELMQGELARQVQLRTAELRAATERLQQSEAALREAYAELEARVEARTRELAIANAQLQQELVERRQAEEALRLLESAVQQAQEAILITDAQLEMPGPHIIFVNQAFSEMTGYTPEEMVGNTPRILQGPRTERAVLDRLQDHLLHGRPFSGETVNYRKDGAAFDTEWHVAPVRDPDGTITHYVSIQRDITERKQVEAQLRLQATALEAAANGIIITDRDGLILWANPAFTTLSGYPLEEIVGKTSRLLKSGKQAPTFYAELWATILGGAVWQGELINRRKSGELYTEEMTITPVRDEGGPISHFIAIKQDVSERRRREQELEALVTVAMALRAAATRAAMWVVVLDQACNLLNADGAAVSLQTPDQAGMVFTLARGVWQHWLGRRVPPNAGIGGQVVVTHQPYVNDDVRTDPQGLPGELEAGSRAVACVPLIADGQGIGALWVGRASSISTQDVRLLTAIADMAATAIQRATLYEQAQRHAAELEQRVTERTRELAQANERLLELDRLKTKFVSDVSHELRTPVTNLILYLNLLERGKAEKRNYYMMVLTEQAARLGTLIEDILDLTRLERDRARIVLAPVDLNAIVEQVVTANELRAEERGLTLTFEPGQGLPAVRGERSQLSQVATNLISNALLYTPAGTITVSTGLDPERQAVYLRVQDTGIGIDPEDLAHLFERFYRGKRVAQSDIPGTGLGLGIVKEIVELHRGTLEVESQIGAGSTFNVWLPTVS